ncbi:DUF436 family protein [Enterococcus cecorum]
MIEKEQLIRDLTTITHEVLAKAQLKAGDIFVLGCSTSEIARWRDWQKFESRDWRMGR